MKLQNAFTLIFIILMFILPFSYAHANKKQEYKYQDWIVDSEGPSVRFYTQGEKAGISFGWIKPFGSCAVNFLLMNNNSYMVQEDYLNQFAGIKMPLKVLFPKIHAQEKIIINAEIIDSYSVNPAWTITRIGLAQAGKRMNRYMEELDRVVIQMPEKPDHLFEHIRDEFSLKGYKAAKTKAGEICHNNSISLIVLNH